MPKGKGKLPENLERHPVTDILYVRAVVHGERIRVSTEETKISRAVDRRNKVLEEARDQAWGLAHKDAPTFEVWWQTYQDDYLGFVAATTRQSYKDFVGRVLRLNGGLVKRRLDAFTRSSCLAIIAGLKRHGYSHNTCRQTAVVFRRVFGMAVADGKLAKNPWRGLKEIGRFEGRVRVLTFEEQERLFPALSPQDQRWVILLLGTGLRVGELSRLTPAQIDWATELLHIIGKGAKPRDVPIADEVATVLRAQQEERGLVANAKTPLWPGTSWRFQRVFQRLPAQLNLPDLTPHVLRHTFATRYVEDNGNIYKLSKILGHASVLTTTKMYVHESKASLVDDLKRRNLGLPTEVPKGRRVLRFASKG